MRDYSSIEHLDVAHLHIVLDQCASRAWIDEVQAGIFENGR